MNKNALPFTPYRKPEQVWDEFVAWWQQRWPGRTLPARYGLYNLVELTELPYSEVHSLLKQRTPPSLLPERWTPA